MMRGRIQHKFGISVIAEPRPGPRTETFAGSDAGCEVACEGERIGDMLDRMEGTDHVVLFRLRRSVLRIVSFLMSGWVPIA